ncbi:hypothetical protein BGZ63DRAFT_352168, partial [Mariannaea sp. PMI_226]
SEEDDIACCSAKLIRRDYVRPDFLFEMNRPSAVTSALAFELFDRYGRFRGEFYNHRVRKGTGVWGKELDEGDILLFETIIVQSEYRRTGVGTLVIKLLMEAAQEKSRKLIAFARPGHLGPLVGSVKEKAQAVTESTINSQYFWQSLGFRRVGNSAWFAFSFRPDHPSKSLPAVDDHQSPMINWEDDIPEDMDEVLKVLVNLESTETQCLESIKNAFPIRPGIIRWPSLTATDRMGNTILHYAAMSHRAASVKHLLSMWPFLAQFRNSDGYTPLEALKSSLETSRAKREEEGETIINLDVFSGFPQAAISCLGLLTGIPVIDLDTLPGDLLLNSLKFKYGCTCGKCVGGFLSPRTRLAVVTQIHRLCDIWREDIETNNGQEFVDDPEVFQFLKSETVAELETSKEVQLGYLNVCMLICRCAVEGRQPRDSNILRMYFTMPRETSAVTWAFLKAGGIVSDVARMLFYKCLREDELAGDGTHARIFQGRISRQPACRNDHEYLFVCKMLGYPIFGDLDLNKIDLDYEAHYED